jgi:hypothetical protein
MVGVICGKLLGPNPIGDDEEPCNLAAGHPGSCGFDMHENGLLARAEAAERRAARLEDDVYLLRSAAHGRHEEREAEKRKRNELTARLGEANRLHTQRNALVVMLERVLPFVDRMDKLEAEARALLAEVRGTRKTH